MVAVNSKDLVRIKEKLQKNGLMNEPFYITENPVQQVPSIMWLEGIESPEWLFSMKNERS